MYVVFCVHKCSFAGLIRRTPPTTFSDTAITDRHSDTTFSSSELTGCEYPGLLDRKKIVRTCVAGGSRTLDFLRERRTPYPLGQALRWNESHCLSAINTTANRQTSYLHLILLSEKKLPIEPELSDCKIHCIV